MMVVKVKRLLIFLAALIFFGVGLPVAYFATLKVYTNVSEFENHWLVGFSNTREQIVGSYFLPRYWRADLRYIEGKGYWLPAWKYEKGYKQLDAVAIGRLWGEVFERLDGQYRVKKWTNEIRIGITNSDRLRREIVSALGYFHSAVDLPILVSELDTKSETHNFIIQLYGDDEKYGKFYHTEPDLENVDGSNKLPTKLPYSAYRKGWYHRVTEDTGPSQTLSKDGFFRDATVFAGQSIHDVEGYILTNPNSEIYEARCFIWDGHSGPEFARLLTRCLARGLGVVRGVVPKNTIELRRFVDAYGNSAPMHLRIDVSLVNFLYREEILPGDNFSSALRVLQN